MEKNVISQSGESSSLKTIIPDRASNLSSKIDVEFI